MKKIAIFALTIVMLNACSKDTDEMRSDKAQADLTQNAGKTSVPFKVELTSSANPASPALACTLPGIPFGIANSGYFMSGSASHMGIINSETSMGIDGSCNLSATTLILTTSTSGQIVAANGDKITYTGDDEINLQNIILNGGTTAAITGLWTITGGTGRFTGATGSFNITGIVDVTTAGGPSFSVTGEGTITY